MDISSLSLAVALKKPKVKVSSAKARRTEMPSGRNRIAAEKRTMMKARARYCPFFLLKHFP
jgi:hypothetical protein